MNLRLEDIANYLGPIREYLAIDGGDIELVSISADGKRLRVRLLGSCRTCDLNATTVQLGILEPLRRYFPSLEAVEILSE
ncbi:MAG: NifU family protein [Bacteroidia bacterium]